MRRIFCLFPQKKEYSKEGFYPKKCGLSSGNEIESSDFVRFRVYSFLFIKKTGSLFLKNPFKEIKS